mgnify:CR=1 FL=1
MTSSKRPETPEEQTAKKVFNIGCGGTILLIALIFFATKVLSSDFELFKSEGNTITIASK